MEKLILKAQIRKETGKKVNSLRRKGYLPAILYGQERKPEPLAILYQDFEKVFKKAGKSTIISLIFDDNNENVLIAEVQINPVTRRFIHADFHQVKMTEKITAEVPLNFVGESPAVKEKDGILVKNIDTIEVSCLPADLPHEIEVDISNLVDFDSAIHIKDLKIPNGVELTANSEEVVALVEPPRSEEELAALEEKPEEEEKEPELIKKEEEVVEGEEVVSTSETEEKVKEEEK